MKALLRFMRRRWWLKLGVLMLIGLIISPIVLRAYTDYQYADEIYTVEAVPAQDIAVIFGARVFPNGRLSTMLRDRVSTGVDLYKAGKVHYLLMTGDGSDASYNEPQFMSNYAVRLGVPPEAIITDSAGFRTYDSCYRAVHVYGIETAILVTQAFHLDRALFLCNELGIDAVGVGADYHRPNGYAERSMRWQWLRELGATTLALADLLRGRNPTVLDDPMPIEIE